MLSSVRCKWTQASWWTLIQLAPAAAKSAMYLSGSSIMRWQSSGKSVTLRSDFTTGGPIVMLGTKWPSITSTCSKDAPPSNTAWTCSPSRAKSADNIDGANSITPHPPFGKSAEVYYSPARAVSLDSLPFTAVDLPMPDPFVALIFIGCTQPGLRTARTRNPGQFLTLSDRHWTLETRSWKLTTVALVEVRNLTKTFPLGESIWGGSAKGEVRAVDDVSLDIHRGETLGLVGESGSGKSTLGRLILRLIEPTSGSVRFDESLDVLSASAAGLRRLRRDMQIIFQDPFGSLDPRMKVADVLAEAAVIHRAQAGRNQPAPLTPAELLRAVGMDESALSRFPHEFSGGQRQRIGIARALAL